MVRLAASCGLSGRQLHAVPERIAEWLQHVTQLFTAASCIAPKVLALLAPPPPPPSLFPHLPTDLPCARMLRTDCFGKTRLNSAPT